ncbi:MAG: VOC family protein [Alkalispirochaeta sp.]
MRFTRSNTILYCSRWQETVAFYRDILELSITMQNEWFVEFHLTSGATLSVADQSRATIDSSRGAGITISLHVDDVDQARTTLEQRDVSPGNVRSIWGAQAFYLTDPEGTRLEFWGT